MFNKKVVFIVLVLSSLLIQAQYKYTTNTAHHSLEKAIRISSDVIEGRTAFFERQTLEKPLMFQKTSVLVGELNRLSNNLSKFIVKTQKEVNTERVLHDLLDGDFYKNILFESTGKLTKVGGKLKIKIDSLYNHAKRINIHQLSQIENFHEDHFRTDLDFYDEDENKITYFDHLFYDKSNYGMMMAMNYLLLDVKTFQLLYFGTVMSL